MQSEVGFVVGIDLRDQVEGWMICDRNILRMDNDLDIIIERLWQTGGYPPGRVVLDSLKGLSNVNLKHVGVLSITDDYRLTPKPVTSTLVSADATGAMAFRYCDQALQLICARKRAISHVSYMRAKKDPFPMFWLTSYNLNCITWNYATDCLLWSSTTHTPEQRRQFRTAQPRFANRGFIDWGKEQDATQGHCAFPTLGQAPGPRHYWTDITQVVLILLHSHSAYQSCG